MNSAEDRAVTNYFCTGLPAAFQNAVGRFVWKELQYILVAESMVLLEKAKAIIKDKL